MQSVCSTNIFCANTARRRITDRNKQPEIKMKKITLNPSLGDGWTRCGLSCRLRLHVQTQEPSPGSAFGKTPDGTPLKSTRCATQGMEATIMTYGGIVTSLKVPDKNGKFGDVVLGFDNLDGYLTAIETLPVFWRAHRPLRQPHRRRKVHARRPDLHAGHQQPPNSLHGG
jgi:hypothetical protein